MLTTARHGLLRASVRVAPASPYSVVCLALDRGFLDDPADRAGLAHLFEHVWFARESAVPTLEWGETRENAVLLYHACPPEEVAAVAAAVADRLRRGAGRQAASRHAAAAAVSLIDLERRGLGERALGGFPGRDIARALRGDPGFDPVAVAPDGLGPPGIARALTAFPAGRARAVSVVGPTTRPSAGELLLAFDRTGSEAAPEPAPPAGPLGGSWHSVARDAAACAAAWVLPRAAGTAAAAWVAAVLVERRAPAAGLRWVSGHALSAYGTAPLRGGHLYAVTAGTDPAGRYEPDLVGDVVAPALRSSPEEVDAARERVLAIHPDAAELAALDALDLLDTTAGGAGGYDAVLDAVRRVEPDGLLRFAGRLASTPYAVFRTGPTPVPGPAAR